MQCTRKIQGAHMNVPNLNEPVEAVDPETFKEKLQEASELIYNDAKKCKVPSADDILKHLEIHGIDLSAEYAREFLNSQEDMK